MKWTVMVVAVWTALIGPPRALAWNDTGHMTSALIAYRQLDDAQKQKVAAILKTHPHYQLYLIANKPEGVSEEEWAFLRGSTWADFIRPARPGSEGELFKGPEVTRYHRGPWHYITIPWVPPADRKTINATTLPSRPEPNAATAFAETSKTLSTAAAKMEDRAVALTWIEHLVGDIHQPLHACSVYSAEYPGGDRGGNEEAVRADGYVQRLHSFWDGILGNSDSYVGLVFLADVITNDPQLAPAKLPELAKGTTFDSWITESHEYAIALAHLNGRLRSVPYAAWDAKQITLDEVPSVPASYAINAHDLAKRRVALAGYRLAEQIKALLGP